MAFVKLLCLLAVIIGAVTSSPYARSDKEYLYDLFEQAQALPRRGDYEPYVDPEDAHLTIPQIIVKYGYPMEQHNITTDDGYVNEAHRIPYGKKCGPAEGKRVIWLQHGLMGDSSNWIISGPERGLGYVLADNCYDVWMGNFRGNTYSKRHDIWDPDVHKEEYWKFSWHEIGMHDVPANIDYALSVTGQESLYYAGHSMGTTSIWVLLSEKPEYNAKIKLMNALAPVSYTEHMISPMRLIAPFEQSLSWIINMFGMHEFLPSSEFMAFIGKTLCNENSPIQFVCSNVLFLIAGYNFDQIDPALLSVAMGHSPAGASAMNILHYGQGVNSALFRKYNFGTEGNMEKYGQPTPPEYDVEKITAPVAFYWGANDWLGSPADTFRLAERISSLHKFHRVDHDNWNHMDFIWAIDINPLLNDPLIKFMENY